MRAPHSLLFILAVATTALNLACEEDSYSEPYIEGIITEIEQHASGGYTVLVEEDTTASSFREMTGKKVAFGIPPARANIARMDDDGRVSTASTSDLEEGQIVQGWMGGPLRQSYPEEASAERLLILERK